MTAKNGHADPDDPMRGKRGRPYALTPTDVLKIRALRRAGWSMPRIAARYGVRRWTIQNVLCKRRGYHPDSWIILAADRMERDYRKMDRRIRPWWAPGSPFAPPDGHNMR